MANQSISNFINAFGGGSRMNRFSVSGSVGVAAGGGNTRLLTDFHIRAASLPASTISPISINYRGRTVQYPGDRTYLPWQILILDDPQEGNKSLFSAFHTWHNDINNHDTNLTTTSGNTNPKNHFAKSVWTIKQFDTNGNKVTREFQLQNCWPISVSEMELDMSKDNVISSFAVTMVYSHYKVMTTTL